MITMVLGGLWHGANWTFVFWGTLHGLYLVINHAFQKLAGARTEALRGTSGFRLFAWLLTFLSVVVAWVFFRATDFSSAMKILAGMAFFGESSGTGTLASHAILANQGLDILRGVCWLAVLSAIAFVLPNSNRLGEMALEKCHVHAHLAPSLLGAALTFSAFLVLINTTRDSVSAFIYFNF